MHGTRGTHLLLENVGCVAVQVGAVGSNFVLELLDAGLLGGLLLVVVGFLLDEAVDRLGRDVESGGRSHGAFFFGGVGERKVRKVVGLLQSLVVY